jgi:hypothetical protein
MSPTDVSIKYLSISRNFVKFFLVLRTTLDILDVLESAAVPKIVNPHGGILRKRKRGTQKQLTYVGPNYRLQTMLL